MSKLQKSAGSFSRAALTTSKNNDEKQAGKNQIARGLYLIEDTARQPKRYNSAGYRDLSHSLT